MTLPRRRGLRIISQPRPPARRRPGSILAFAWVLPAVLFLGLLQAAGTPGSQQTSLGPGHSRQVKQSDKEALENLKKQADKTANQLSAATAEYKRNKSKVALADARLERTKIEAARANQVYEKWRKRVASFADAMYRSPTPDSNSVLLTAPDSEQAVQQATSLNALADGQEKAITKAGKEKKRADALTRQAAKLAKSTQKKQSELAAQVTALKKKSAASTKALLKLLTRLNGGAASRDASRAVLDASCGNSGEADIRTGSFSNGLLPDWVLCPLPGYSGDKLRADAARSFVDMNAAYTQHFGKKICVTDSYRSLAAQQAVYAQKGPGLAATPGTSNHGYGLALDLGCGVNSFDTPQYNWLKANGKQWGWVHPEWAETSQPEPWHWEWQPGAHTETAD